MDTRDGYVAGLRFARLLRERWPAFYAVHRLGKRNPYPETLLGMMGAFLSLAHNDLVMLDINAHAMSPTAWGGWNCLRLPFSAKHPYEALDPIHGRQSAMRLLANEGTAWLARPLPKVYGINVEGEIAGHAQRHYPPAARTMDSGLFMLAVWKLLGATAWSPLPLDRMDDLAQTRATNERLGQAIADVLQPIAATTPLAPLCAALDAHSPNGLPRLGTMIAYACSRTGNQFADVPQAALRQDDGHLVFNLNWLTTDFARLRVQQLQAQTWRRSLSGTQGRFLRDWGRLLPVLRDAVRAATTLAQQHDWGLSNEESTYQPDVLHWNWETWEIAA